MDMMKQTMTFIRPDIRRYYSNRLLPENIRNVNKILYFCRACSNISILLMLQNSTTILLRTEYNYNTVPTKIY